MMEEHVYQDIFNELQKYLRQGWETMIFYLEYGEASYSMAFYVKENGQYVKCFDIPGISESELDASFRTIDFIVYQEREKLEEPWTTMTMVVDSSGRMHTDFDYVDLSDGAYQYLKGWKKKYLV